MATIRLDKDIYKRISALSEKSGISKQALANSLLELALDTKEDEIVSLWNVTIEDESDE